MYKKINIITLFLISFLIISGCTVKNQAEEKQNQQSNQQNKEQQADENQRQAWNENFEEISFSDLEIGQQVLVMGIEDSDGSITASRVIVGNEETNFDEIGQHMRIDNREEGGDEDNHQDFQRPEGMPDFQNMSDEEREAFREQMMAGGGTRPNGMGNFQRGNTDQATARMTGEIIGKDDESVTIKLDEGGSKFVFFSDSTVIMKIK